MTATATNHLHTIAIDSRKLENKKRVCRDDIMKGDVACSDLIHYLGCESLGRFALCNTICSARSLGVAGSSHSLASSVGRTP